jgi:hypothetical protein
MSTPCRGKERSKKEEGEAHDAKLTGILKCLLNQLTENPAAPTDRYSHPSLCTLHSDDPLHEQSTDVGAVRADGVTQNGQ